MIKYNMIYLLTAIGLTPGGSSTVHIYTQIIHRTTKLKLRGLSPHANYTDRAAAAGRRS